MPKVHCTIRSLVATTLSVAVLLSIGIAQQDKLLAYFNTTKKTDATDVIPILLKRVDPSSSEEIEIPAMPLVNDSK
jgi:hypothetical protein